MSHRYTRYSHIPAARTGELRPDEYDAQELPDHSPHYLDTTDSDGSPSLRAPRTGALSSTPALRIVGFGMHLLLIGVHVTFMVVKHKGLERHVVIPLGNATNRLSVILPASSQAIWAIYLAITLVLTQELALCKILATTQFLTATHDGVSAWSGVGSALLGLLRQFSLPASITGVFYVAVYLVAAHVLHITAPSLLTLVAANITVAGGATVTKALPVVSPFLADSASAAAGAAAGLLPVLGNSQILTTPGLDGNILYDVPIQETATGIIAVDLTVVDVECGSIPGVKQVGRKSDLSWTIGANHSGSAFMFDLGLNDTEASQYYTPASLYMGLSLYDNPTHQFSNNSIYWPDSGGSIRAVDFNFPVTTPDAVAFPFYGSNIIFWSFVNVTDVSNTNASYVPLSPSFPLNFLVQNGVGTLGQGIQVIGCTISISQGQGRFDAHNGQLLDRPDRRSASTWKPWVPTLYNNNKPGSGGPTLEETLGMLMTGPLRDKAAIPEYLSGHTGLPLTTFDASYANAAQPALVQLPQFEDALANATAIVLWTASRIGGTKNDALFSLKQSLAPIVQQVPALRLNINFVPLITGLSASCVLFIVFWIVTPSRSFENVVNGAGILHVLWYFADSVAQRRIASVPKEGLSLDSLRKAGMFEVSASYAWDVDGKVRRMAATTAEDAIISEG